LSYDTDISRLLSCCLFKIQYTDTHLTSLKAQRVSEITNTSHQLQPEAFDLHFNQEREIQASAYQLQCEMNQTHWCVCVCSPHVLPDRLCREKQHTMLSFTAPGHTMTSSVAVGLTLNTHTHTHRVTLNHLTYTHTILATTDRSVLAICAENPYNTNDTLPKTCFPSVPTNTQQRLCVCV